ncbi:exocyst complex component EXO70B1-like [Gastrolobium bilobum]|uniref:exocyst complex component EXO70B1-like n=1 Tax=Gastrolobium bilobum TaxID=150636 RepID=UPI002AB0942A|nr:exocyst complex component EXO70B1-like [Gastrolobium bilobum]
MIALCIAAVAILTHLRESSMHVAVQIRGWLVWRFVGLASTVVGLLCYALSSAFNHLFGKWYSWKIFLYIVVSVFICLLILFPEIWQRLLISPRFKTHSPFWVVSITSVYSFFFDKAVSGKSDVYNLISCAAFAIVSLSLSRRTHCGFEKDLLYFFLGVLIVRLMMIKIALGILGVCFGYFLHYLCYSDAPPREYVGLQSVVIELADDSPQPQAASTDINASMAHQLRTYMKELTQVYLNATYTLFPYFEEYDELEVTERNYVMEALPSSLINDLEKTVKAMMAAGFKKECYDVYIKSRRKCLVDCVINYFLFRAVNNDKDIAAGFGIDVLVIRRLAEALKVTLGILFYGEQRLFDGVFSGFSDASYPCFLQICEGLTLQLLDLIDAVVSARRSGRHWRPLLYAILYLFNTLGDLIPEFQLYFPESLVNKAIEMQNRLEEASRDIFMDLGNNLISRSPTLFNVSHHPMTTEAMDCIVQGSREIQNQIFEHYLKVSNKLEKSSSFYDLQKIKSSCAIPMAWMLRQLQTESKNIEDPAWQNFLMLSSWFNVECISIEKGLKTLLGEADAKVVKYLELYVRNSWEKGLEFLNLESYNSMDPNIASESMINKLTLFNKHFRDTCTIQSSWSASYRELGEQMVISIENILLPAYGKFIDRFHHIIGKRSYEEYIKYGIDDIQDRLHDLFRGIKA